MHLHVLTTPASLPADGTPFAFDCVDLRGRMPLDRDVLTFGC